MSSKIDEIIAKQKALAAELDTAMKEERANVLADVKTKIKMFGFKTSDFKGVLATRKKRTVKAKSTAAKK